jgi:small subunit ribosomal protein S17e
MGRIKPTLVKRTAEELLEMHRADFTEKFDDNKLASDKHADIPSKRLRNSIAGYITRLVKRHKDEQ